MDKYIDIQLEVGDALKLLFAIDGDIDLPPMLRRNLLAQVATVVYSLKEENKRLEMGANKTSIYCVGREMEDAVNILVQDVMNHNVPLDINTLYESAGNGREYDWGVDIQSIPHEGVKGDIVRHSYRIAGKKIPGGYVVTWYEYKLIET